MSTRDNTANGSRDATELTPDRTTRRPVRDGKGRFISDRRTAERDAECADLRAQGLSLREVGERVGMSAQGVGSAVERALVAARQPAGEVALQLELRKLDIAERTAWEALNSTNWQVSHGTVVRVSGELQRDWGPNLQALDRLLKVSARRAKLQGLDAPVTAQLTTLEQIPIDVLDNLIAQAEADLADAETHQRMIEARKVADDER